MTYPPPIRTLRTLLTLLIPPPEGGGEVFFGDTPGGPLPHGLEALLGQGHACQLLLDGREQETVSADALAWGVGEALGHHPFLHQSSNVGRGTVKVKKLESPASSS